MGVLFNCSAIKNWSLKPQMVSPVDCARYGWRYVDRNLMQCDACHHYCATYLPVAFNIELGEKIDLKRNILKLELNFLIFSNFFSAVEAFTQRMKQSLINGHEKTCTWRSYPTSSKSFSLFFRVFFNAFDFRNGLKTQLKSHESV